MIGPSDFRLPLLALFPVLIATSSIAHAQGTPILLRDSFPIGSGDGTLCQVQDRSIENKTKQSIFDRSWAVVCRDSARPVSFVYAFRAPETDVMQRIARHRANAISCPENKPSVIVDGLKQTSCKLSDEPVAYSIFQEQSGNTTYVAEGLAVYDSATTLALKSIMADKTVKGKIDIASTSIEDPFAFARVQALTLKPDQALAEGYRRNLSGDYAEAAAFFETLQQRTSGLNDVKVNPQEYFINRALQKSNLGEFAEADELFREAKAVDSGSVVNQKLLRNFEAIHLLNQGRYEEAVTRVNLPIAATESQRESLVASLTITQPIAMRLNGDDKTASLLGLNDDLKLTAAERGQIIDAQALQLIGTAQRIRGDDAEAQKSLTTAYNQAVAVRDGRVTSITRLRTQILSELALIAETRGEFANAEQLLRNALELVELQYPQTRAVNGAKAKLASYLLRQDKQDEARQYYREVVDSTIGKRSAATGIANQLAPYFDLMTKDPDAAEEFFKASQILVRPGVAETQAVLSRELKGGTDEASRLFRQSANLDRSIERLRMRFTALGKIEQTTTTRQRRSDLAAEIEELERSQQLTIVSLAQYPQYRAVAGSSIALADLRASMIDNEAYLRMAIVGNDVFIFYTEKDFATMYKTSLSADALDEKVDLLRASISAFENGQYVTYPFDIEASRSLYQDLMGPVSERLAAKSHLIFEPDGAMLRLPINLFVVDDASVTEYLARVEQPDGDPFDYTGVRWLGTDINISTAVSARGFADARQAPVSKASRQYLGLGNNQPVAAETGVRRVRAAAGGVDAQCNWALNEWNNPISDAELIQARSIIGQGGSEILTGTAFSDDKILAKSDISEYRILHFATHGLVTAPKPSCPAKPALLTSFGGEKSDGLLAFDEIFDMKLDADIVILSACDTAGKASIRATREAGVSSGGGTALDGLVRSFIGAGSRSVLASHWPAPDDFQATERLIGGLFDKGQGQSIASALRTSQKELMDDPVTSHPYYWSGFAIIGDGSRPFLPDGSPTGQTADVAGTSDKKIAVANLK
ncbi:CHAT domain-containing protein [Parasphingorhabdus cellanae]|uniref:CHAT domain-containing protein n=1 Tax=Parasphingorhabdus cellanae TaxID=2806553 RepID=A0ABX7T4N1_9SPHN|nr:CHAT domain-containing protein [Parasphingorhabdus cellanae]QTD55502.1 CHAT domain-containing protein [Parasphingorhabdus cellanae]